MAAELKDKIGELIQMNNDALRDDDFWDNLSAEIKHVINFAKEELDRGEGIPHSQIMAEIKDRFLNTR